MFPGLKELLLICCSMESTWTQKSKSSTSTPKTNLLTSQPKEISHVLSGSFVVLLFNISHFSSTVCSETMAKRSQHDSGEERVTAKSKPMMNLIARTPWVVSSSTSLSPGKKNYGKQDPWKSVADNRSGQPDRLSSTDYSKLDYDRAWSSQEWKTEDTTYDRSGRPDKTSWRMVQKVRLDNINSQEVARPQILIMGNDETELELSVESRSFVNRVNDQVRKNTETNFKCYRRWRKTFYDLVNVHDCDYGISSIHGKELPEQLSFHFEYNRSHTQTNVRHIYKIGV